MSPKIIKYDPTAGSDIKSSSNAMKKLAIELGEGYIIEFKFNDRIVSIDKDTNIDWLCRDFTNSFSMGWERVGLNQYGEEYPSDIQQIINDKRRKRKEDDEKEKIRRQEKEKKERVIIENKIRGIEMEFFSENDKREWKEMVEKNQDDYGKCCVDFARDWAKLMQLEISKGKTVAECAKETSFAMPYYGLSGYMHSAAKNLLLHCWRYKEELRQAYE